MNETIMLAFTIILSFVGIVISTASLVLALIYLVRIIKLQKDTKNIKIISEILIQQAVLYSDKEMIRGYNALKLVKDSYNINDDLEALKLIYTLDNNTKK